MANIDAAPRAPEKTSAFLRIVYAIPFIGWMLKDAATGRDSAAGFFGFNVAALAVIATLIWGLPALVISALGAAFMIACMLIVITRG
ncbi:MAG: hypothetical protein AAGF90_17785 [Pseudomonadota bacterium]